MDKHCLEITLKKDGSLTLNDLPFHAGETVEVTIVPKPTPANHGGYALRGTPVKYSDPFEPVAAEEWEAAE
jgi:hypothetical protein